MFKPQGGCVNLPFAMTRLRSGSAELRRHIYYWKCDRPAAFHGVLRQPEALRDVEFLSGVREVLWAGFAEPFDLVPSCGEGTHRTYLLRQGRQTLFVRVEDGPEGDGHLAEESRVLEAVTASGIPAPHVHFCDVSRQRAPLAVQVITHYEAPDLNRFCRERGVSATVFAEEIGRWVARWQAMPVKGFGPFQSQKIGGDAVLKGFHASYADYFHLHLDRHLALLQDGGFLSPPETNRIARLIADHRPLLDVGTPCLVHKDLALWNILGTEVGIAAFIDWDDAIGGDATDDLSLLACFHSWDFLELALRGYESIRPLPVDFCPRFWLHLLRNMIVKAVIRLGAGYFDRPPGGFLTPQGGPALRQATRTKLLSACQGLQENRPLSDL